jgi:hypothetical protein
MRRDARQINIRIDQATYDVLETLRYLRDLRGMQELLEPVVAGYAVGASDDERVKAALRARQESLASEPDEGQSTTSRRGKDG